ncbi:MAG: hypothetical protein Q8Q09_06790 [Deltaproteobacteria bacterium]|nr:hypothetical protein [Deltaproteobacteria bacterium]
MKIQRTLTSLPTLAALCALSCGAPFAAPNLVTEGRVLLVIANPVIVQPGQTLTARALLGGDSTLRTQRWRVCVPVRIDPFPEQRCADGEGIVAHTQQGGDTLSWTLPTDQETLGPWILGASVDANGNTQRLDQVLASLRTNGLDMLVYVEAAGANGVVLRSVKRVLMAITNTPRVPTLAMPRFNFAGTEWSARDGRCVLEDGSNEHRIPSGLRTIFMPLDTGAGFGENTFHYADGGDFSQRFDRAVPVSWTAPRMPGVVTRHWLIVTRRVSRTQGTAVTVSQSCELTVRTE